MTRRPGLTMTELLVAIFIVAIGLAGVMSMVPFGAKQMSDALVADRTATHATAIDGMMRSYWKQKIVEDKTGNGSGEPFWQALDNAASLGAPPTPAPATTPLTVAAGSAEQSFPVFIDPMGFGVTRPTVASNNWVGDNGDTYIPRRTMTGFANPDQAVRMWSQPDGFSWDDDSQPKSGAEMREFRYNALAVIQRPTNSDRNVATLKIVVFSNRRPRFFPTGSEHVIPKSANVTFTPTATAIQIPTAQVPANVELRKGGWIMDATVDGTLRQANFYRIVSVLENTPGTFDVELHTPIKRADGGTNQYTATLVLMPGVAAVFERPPLTGGFSP